MSEKQGNPYPYHWYLRVIAGLSTGTIITINFWLMLDVWNEYREGIFTLANILPPFIMPCLLLPICQILYRTIQKRMVTYNPVIAMFYVIATMSLSGILGSHLGMLLTRIYHYYR